MNTASRDYIKLLEDDEKTKVALLTCAAALRLDDEVATGAIKLVAESNGSTSELLRRVKNLGCIWKQGDGTWYVAEEVRKDFVEHLYQIVSAPKLVELREHLSSYAHQLAASFSPDGQLTEYRVRQAKIEAAYHQTMIPDRAEDAAAQMTEVWRQASSEAKKATADSVDYLAEELARRVETLPPDILFLQGMAARSRGGREGRRKQLQYFGAVYNIGREKTEIHGYIYGIAAHLYGLLLRNHKKAKQAFIDSIDWYDSSDHRAQVYNSLGHLLSEDENSWEEAENAFTKSLDLRHDASHQGQVYHSLGKLLSKDHRRWPEAIAAYEKSLSLRDNKRDKAQVLTSWADLLLEFKTAEGYEQAQELAEKSLALDPNNPSTIGMCHRILAVVYEQQGKYDKAIDSLKILQETNRKLGKREFEELISLRITELQRLEEMP